MIFLKLFRESFLFAFDALRQNKLRTLLSLLGRYHWYFYHYSRFFGGGYLAE